MATHSFDGEIISDERTNKKDTSLRINFIPSSFDELLEVTKLINNMKYHKTLNLVNDNMKIDIFEAINDFKKYTFSLLIQKNELPAIQIFNYSINYTKDGNKGMIYTGIDMFMKYVISNKNIDYNKISSIVKKSNRAEKYSIN